VLLLFSYFVAARGATRGDCLATGRHATATRGSCTATSVTMFHHTHYGEYRRVSRLSKSVNSRIYLVEQGIINHVSSLLQSEAAFLCDGRQATPEGLHLSCVGFAFQILLKILSRGLESLMPFLGPIWTYVEISSLYSAQTSVISCIIPFHSSLSTLAGVKISIKHVPWQYPNGGTTTAELLIMCISRVSHTGTLFGFLL
jgi:hypothetical protein